jgi:GDP-4-dehydro-6-deoxy-D-mannose reductase
MTAAPRTIFMTGARGFVGLHLQAALRTSFPGVLLTTPGIDVQDAAQVDDAIRSTTPDVCIHLAAVSAIASAKQSPEYAWKVNFHGTRHVAQALLRHAPACQMLFISSADAYGTSFNVGQALDERALLAPVSIYAQTKAAADAELGAMATRGLRVVRLRPFNHTGPGQSADFVVAAFARQIARIHAGFQPPVVEVGNLETWRDFLDVRDVCAAYIACIVNRDLLVPGTILNVASGRSRRVHDVLTGLAALAGVALTIKVDVSRVRENDVRLASGDASRARELLGWSPAIQWTQTLLDVFEDWRSRVGA